MITSFFLVGLDIITAQIWNDWNNILIDTFIDSTVFGNDISADSFTDLLWDQLDFGDAIASASTLMFESWLTGVDFEAWLTSTTSQLVDVRSLADSNVLLSTSEIIDEIEDTGFDSTELGWKEEVDLHALLDNLQSLAMYMEVLSYTEGMDLSAFPSLESLENLLTDFGYPRVYSMSEIEEFLNGVASEIPDSFPFYQSEVESIKNQLAEIISDDSDAPSIEDVLSNMEELIDDMQSQVDNGDTSLSTSVDDLKTAYIALGMYTKDPAEILLNTSEVLLALFDNTNFDYNNLDSGLGEDWLISFVGAMQEINDDEEVCPDNYIRDIMNDQYSLWEMLRYCPLLYVGNAPDCNCLNNAGIYEDDDKQDVLKSMNCLFEDGDGLTVEQQLRVCNGEVIEVNEQDKILDALETLESLTDLLTGDNYGSSLVLYVATDQLSDNFQDIIDDVEDLSDIRIITDGTDREYLDSVSDYIESFNDLLSDLDFDGSYADQSEAISDSINQAFDQVNEEVDGNDEESGKSGHSSDKVIWIIVVLCVFVLCLGMCWCRLKRRKISLENKIELETGIEYSGEGELPEGYEKKAGTAEANGESGM